jgi:hypothetical protein
VILFSYLIKNQSNGGRAGYHLKEGVLMLFITVPTLFVFLLGPLYVLTLLSNFNMRQNVSNRDTSRTVSESRGHNIMMDGIREFELQIYLAPASACISYKYSLCPRGTPYRYLHSGPHGVEDGSSIIGTKKEHRPTILLNHLITGRYRVLKLETSADFGWRPTCLSYKALTLH